MKSIFDTGETLYADGGCVLKNPSEIGITWAYCLVDADDKLIRSDYGFIAFKGGTNNQAEMISCVIGMESLPLAWCGTLASDSKITLGRLFEGNAVKNLPLDYVKRAKAAMERLGVVEPKHLDGHATKKQLETGIGKNGNPTSKWNSECDRLANLAKVGHQ